MTTKFIFKNTGEKEINDVPLEILFPLLGHSYSIRIKPRVSFWRIGLRLGVDRRGISWSTTHRYNNTQVQHIEICAGIRSNGKWEQSGRIELQQYNILNTPPSLFTSEHYQELSELHVKIQANQQGRVGISISSGQDISYTTEVNVGFAKIFQVFAWADSLDFEVECDVTSELTPIKLELEKVKALSCKIRCN